jgi:hypothetical protein
MAKESRSAVVDAAEEQKLDAHQKELDERRERQRKNYPATVACLDPETAARVVSQRPLYRFEISYDHPKQGKFASVEVAENEVEAWAKFCDRHSDNGMGLPSPKSPGRTIKPLGKLQTPQSI